MGKAVGCEKRDMRGEGEDEGGWAHLPHGPKCFPGGARTSKKFITLLARQMQSESSPDSLSCMRYPAFLGHPGGVGKVRGVDKVGERLLRSATSTQFSSVACNPCGCARERILTQMFEGFA